MHLDELPAALAALWERLGARTGPWDPRQLLAAYAEPPRVYHATAHLADCLRQFADVRHLAARPDEVEAALWFHDAVYDPRATDNEERSAAMSRQGLVADGVAEGIAERVAGMVLATKHTATPDDHDARLLVDVDLSILGREPAAFDAYERQIRQEYAWVPEADFRRGRARILEGFLSRPAIFATAALRNRYEAQARHNLERSLAALRPGSPRPAGGPGRG